MRYGGRYATNAGAGKHEQPQEFAQTRAVHRVSLPVMDVALVLRPAQRIDAVSAGRAPEIAHQSLDMVQRGMPSAAAMPVRRWRNLASSALFLLKGSPRLRCVRDRSPSVPRVVCRNLRPRAERMRRSRADQVRSNAHWSEIKRAERRTRGAGGNAAGPPSAHLQPAAAGPRQSSPPPDDPAKNGRLRTRMPVSRA